MKKFIVMVLIFVLALPVCAMAEQVSSERVLDKISYFSEEELIVLEERIAQFEEATGVVFWVETSNPAKSLDAFEDITNQDLLELVAAMEVRSRINALLNIGINKKDGHYMTWISVLGPAGTLKAYFSDGFEKAGVQVKLGKAVDGVLACLDSAEELLLAAE